MIEPQQGQTVYDVREIYDDDTGVLRLRQIRLNGLRHAPPSDEPSHAVYDEDGNPVLFKWHAQDVEHRAGKPSSIRFHAGSDKPETEVFETYGEPRPEAEGYHIIRRDLEGNITEAWTDRDWRRRWNQSGRRPRETPEPPDP